MNRNRKVPALAIVILSLTLFSAAQNSSPTKDEGTPPLNVAILVWDGVQIIDYTGPYEVFNHAANFDQRPAFHVYTVSEKPGNVTTAMGMIMTPTHSFDNAPKADVLVVPGGGVRKQFGNQALLRYIQTQATDAKVVMSVCGGSLILARTGLLDGMEATTTAGINVHDLQVAAPKATVIANRRLTDNGKIVTTAGLSSGIDGSLHVIEKFFGRATAQQAALGVEYNWDPDSKYSRSALADQYMQFDYDIKLLPGGWKPLLSTGDTHHWEERYLVKSASSAPEIFEIINHAIANNSFHGTHPPLKWNQEKIQNAKGGKQGVWRFKDETGHPWRGSVSVEPLPDQANNFVLSMKVERTS